MTTKTLDRSALCDAIVQDKGNVIYRAPVQRITAYGSKPCSKKSVETVGHLSLCRAHARLARDGLVSEQGRVACPADIRAVRRYPKQFPNGLFLWAHKLEQDQVSESNRVRRQKDKMAKGEAQQAINALAGGTRKHLHFRAPEALTSEQIGKGSPCTISIGSDSYGAVVVALRRNAAGEIVYVKAHRASFGEDVEFRLRKGGQLRSPGRGGYGLVLGYAEDRRDPSF